MTHEDLSLESLLDIVKQPDLHPCALLQVLENDVLCGSSPFDIGDERLRARVCGPTAARACMGTVMRQRSRAVVGRFEAGVERSSGCGVSVGVVAAAHNSIRP